MSVERTQDLCGESEFLAELGTRLRELRKTCGMSRHDLACASHVSERYIALIESGRGNVSILLLRRLASALCRAPTAKGHIELLSGLRCNKVEATEM